MKKKLRSVIIAGAMLAILSFTACTRQVGERPSDDEIKSFVQNHIIINIDDKAKITDFIQNEILATDEIYEVIVDAIYDSNQGIGQITFDITYKKDESEWWVSKMVVSPMVETTNTYDSLSENVSDSLLDASIDSNSHNLEDKTKEKLSDEVLAQLEKLSIAAESENGKAIIYYDETAYNERLSWNIDMYLLYDNKFRKLPYSWFTKYSTDGIAVECRDFDGDGSDEIAIMKSWIGGTMINVSDVVFIENPGTEKEHHYIYNTSLDEDWAYEYGIGDFQVDDYQLTGIHVDVYDYIEEYVISGSSNYYTIGIREKNSDYNHNIATVISDNGNVYWDNLVDIKISYDGFDVLNKPCTFYESSLTDWRDIHISFKYLGDGKIELNNIY